ncbi:MAG: cell division protein FtsZ [Malacoplasma sp.]
MSKNNIDKILNAIDEDNIYKKSSVSNNPSNKKANLENLPNSNIDDLGKYNNNSKSINDVNIQPHDSVEFDGDIKITKHVNSIINEINKNTRIKTMSKDRKFFSKTFNIKVIGVGGAGNNIIKYMKTSQIWPEFIQIIALNTDFVALSNMGDLSDIFILGADELDGNGSGGDPNIGRMAAETDSEIIKEMLVDTDILILVAGLGKGTGTGATPVIAKIAQDLGILTIGLFNLPSIGAEGNKIYSNALSGLQKLSYLCNGLTTVNNDKIISLDRERTSIKKAYQGANKYIKEIIVELINIIVKPSDINIDFADVRNFFEDKNGFLFLKIELNDYSKDSIKEAFENAIKSGFSEININDSQKALLNFKLNENVPSVILENARSALKEIINTNNINIVHGISYNDNFEGAEINVLLIGSFELGSISEDYFESKSTDGQKILATSSIDIDELDENFMDENDYLPVRDIFLGKSGNDSNGASLGKDHTVEVDSNSVESMYNKFLNSKNDSYNEIESANTINSNKPSLQNNKTNSNNGKSSEQSVKFSNLFSKLFKKKSPKNSEY